jgi:LPXTG-site transpeptidase (sortase) family protein
MDFWRWIVMLVMAFTLIGRQMYTLLSQPADTAFESTPEPSVRLIIPRIGVNVPVTRFALGVETWEIDPWETRVGHFEGTAWLDRPGNIVLGGHAEYPDGAPAVFSALGDLRIGSVIKLAVDDTIRTYRVIETKSVASDDLRVLYPTETAQLTLITCDKASYDAAARVYDQRVVVIAVYQPEE